MLVLSTEDVNRYGYRVLTSGIRTENFLRNPVLLYDHNLFSDLPIGKVENLRVENGKLVGDPIFDEDDERARMVKAKYDKGMLNAASIGIQILKTSESPDDMVAGQTRPTVVECDLLEVSIVAIPANPNAVKLSLEEGQTLDDVLPKIEDMKLEKIAQTLGFDKADEQQMIQAIEQLKAENEALRKQIAEFEEARKAAVLEEAKTLGIDEQAMQGLVALLDHGNETGARALLDALKAQKQRTLSDTINRGTNQSGADERATWTFDDWSRRDPDGLLAMKRTDPARYRELAQQKLQSVATRN